MRIGQSGAISQLVAATSLLVCLVCVLPASAQSTIRPGWGFNWRLKQKATCRLIDASVLPVCSKCRELANAYQSGVDAQACHLVPKFEYMIFPNEVDCQKGLDLMKQGGSP